MRTLFCVYLVSFILAASATIANDQPLANDTPYVECPTPRPQDCDDECKPVCANRDTGIRCVTTPCPAAVYVQYDNACSACRDNKVMGYLAGTCADREALETMK